MSSMLNLLCESLTKVKAEEDHDDMMIMMMIIFVTVIVRTWSGSFIRTILFII